MATQDYKLALDITKLVSNVIKLLGKIGVFTTKILTSIMTSVVTGIGAIVGVIGLIISINSWLDSLSDLKKGRDTCYGMYRRIRSLIEFTEPNEICYKHFKSLTDWTEKTLLTMREFLVNRQTDIVMAKKLFVPSDFNSFILYQNILSWLDLNEAIITANNGAYCDYIEFVSLTDYIDTNKVFEQDKARLEILILNNDVDILTKFLLSLETLQKELKDRFKDKNLTDWTKNDLINCLNYTNTLLSIFSQDGELYHNLKSQIQPQHDDVASIMLSIFRYLDYGYGLINCGYENLKSLYSQDEILSGLPIDNYVSNDVGFEWILNILRPYMVDYGIIIFNDIYIKKYKTEIEQTYNSNKELYDKKFYSDIITEIENLENLSLSYYENNFLLQVLQYKDYLKINPEMVTYYGYDSNNQIIPKRPDIKNYITFNYKNIYDYILSLKQTGLYNNYFSKSKMFNDNTVYDIDLAKTWLEKNTYHWYDNGYIWKGTFLDILNSWQTPEDCFNQYILNDETKYAEVFINAFQYKNTRANCGQLEGIGRDFYRKGFNNKTSMKDKNAIYNLVNSKYRTVYSNKLKDWFSNIFKNINFYDLMWNSYLETWKTGIYDRFNNKREEIFNSLLNQDIQILNDIIAYQQAELSKFEIKNSDYGSIFSDQITDKYNQKLFNLMVEALKLERSNFGKYVDEKVLALPYYQFDNGNLYFTGFIKPIDILRVSYIRKDITDLFYALNQFSFDKLFEYADGNFYQKLMQIDEAFEIRADNYELVVKYKAIQDYLKEKMESKTQYFTKDELINSFNQETIEDELLFNKQYLEQHPELKEIFQTEKQQKIDNTTEKIALEAQENKSQVNMLIDKKLLKKYTLYGILGLGLVKIFRR